MQLRARGAYDRAGQHVQSASGWPGYMEEVGRLYQESFFFSISSTV